MADLMAPNDQLRIIMQRQMNIMQLQVQDSIKHIAY